MPTVKKIVPEQRVRRFRTRGVEYRMRELPAQDYRRLMTEESTENPDGTTTTGDEFLRKLVISTTEDPKLTIEQLSAFPTTLTETLISQAVQTNLKRDEVKVTTTEPERKTTGGPLFKVDVFEARGITFRAVELSAEDNAGLRDKFTHPNAYGVQVIDQEPYLTALTARTIEEPRLSVPQLVEYPNALLATVIERCRDLNQEQDDVEDVEEIEEVTEEDDPSPDA